VTALVLPEAPLWVRLTSQVIRRLPLGRYRMSNWLSARPAPPFWAETLTQRGRHQFACDVRDGIAREVCFTGRYEPLETMLIEQLLKPAMTFVDVGANWGYFTLLAAGCTGSAGQVVSFEPDPRLFSLLKANLQRNDLNHVVPLSLAASDRRQTIHLAGYDEQGGNWGLSRVTNQAGPGTFEVDGCRIDDVLDDLSVEDVDLLKMDIEGAEDLALAGMTDGLDRGRYRAILLEVHPAHLAERGADASQVIRLLAEKGYRAWRLNHSPQASRRAAYRRTVRLSDYLAPFSKSATLDAWPHLLWLAPNVPLPDQLR